MKLYTASSIAFGIFRLVFRFIFESIISQNLDQFVKLFLRHTLRILEQGRPSKERKTEGWPELGSNKFFIR